MIVIVDHTKDVKRCNCCGETKNLLMGFSPKGTYCRDCQRIKTKQAKLRGYGSSSGYSWTNQKRFIVPQKLIDEAET